MESAVNTIPTKHRALSELLVPFLLERRWYRDKTRTIAQAEVADVIQVPGTSTSFLTLKLTYEEGDAQTYLLGIAAAEGSQSEEISTRQPESVIAQLDEDGSPQDQSGGILYDAFFNPDFCRMLVQAIADESVFPAETAQIKAHRAQAFAPVLGETSIHELTPKISKAEQSNTSVIFGDRFILKIFRKLEEGINPDIEIGMFLTERNFKHSPAVAGSLEYQREDGGSIYAGILQQFVRNKGDAWAYTLDSLSRYFPEALSKSDTPTEQVQPESHHPLLLMNSEVPREARDLIGPYLDSASLLGERTAQMHCALTDLNAGPDFVPEPFSKQDSEELYQSLALQADQTLSLLRQQLPTLKADTAEMGARLLDLEPQIRGRFDTLRETDISAMRIRHHGDYHLGQVLYTGSDFLIIDYEGEPARSLAERRQKRIAMRDVAGMIRSFQYASFAALFGQVSELVSSEQTRPALEAYAEIWTAWVSAAYLKSYFAVAAGQPFTSHSVEERKLLFDAFLLQKALYEVSYELNNRPAWLGIPLRGIVSLIS